MNAVYAQLDAVQRRVLADALGDTPETVISVHLLKLGLCRAYVAGDPGHFRGAVVQAYDLPTEPMGFGSDPTILWGLLRSIEGWECVNVSRSCAVALGGMIEAEMGVGVRYYGDIHHTLTRPVSSVRNAAVRQLTLADVRLLEGAPAELRGSGFGSTHRLLSDGVVACAIVSGQIVAIAHTDARTERHADIGVFALEEWRDHGFATAAAAIVANRVQEAGQIPVWSTGEDNLASLRVAQKLGFCVVSRRAYVIVEKDS